LYRDDLVATLSPYSLHAETMPGRRKEPATAPPRESDRITYRELRNTPGRVWERLAKDEPLTLVAEEEAKAVVRPRSDGDAAAALEACRCGRAMMAVARLRRDAGQSGSSKHAVDEINELIAKVRIDRGRRDRAS
jgi:hypothetical protein